MAIEKDSNPERAAFMRNFGFFKLALSGQHVGKPPIDLRIADRNRSAEAAIPPRQSSFREQISARCTHAFTIHRQDGKCPPIPLGAKGRLGLRYQFAPKHAEWKQPVQWETATHPGTPVVLV